MASHASRAQALLDLDRDLEAISVLDPRATAALSDENELGPEVMAWAVASRADCAAQRASANGS